MFSIHQHLLLEGQQSNLYENEKQFGVIKQKTLEIMLVFKDTSFLLLWCSLPRGVCGVVVVLMMLCEEREAGRTDRIVSCQIEVQAGLIVHHLMQ